LYGIYVYVLLLVYLQEVFLWCYTCPPTKPEVAYTAKHVIGNTLYTETTPNLSYNTEMEKYKDHLEKWKQKYPTSDTYCCGKYHNVEETKTIDLTKVIISIVFFVISIVLLTFLTLIIFKIIDLPYFYIGAIILFSFGFFICILVSIGIFFCGLSFL